MHQAETQAKTSVNVGDELTSMLEPFETRKGAHEPSRLHRSNTVRSRTSCWIVYPRDARFHRRLLQGEIASRYYHGIPAVILTSFKWAQRHWKTPTSRPKTIAENRAIFQRRVRSPASPSTTGQLGRMIVYQWSDARGHDSAQADAMNSLDGA